MYKAKYKNEYKNLVRQGKKTEANKVLQKLRDYSNNKIIVEGTNTPLKSDERAIAKPSGEATQKTKKRVLLEDLIEIKGVGKKTVEDIKRIYNSTTELRKAIKKDKVPLRDDIVKKIKKYLER